MHNFMCVVFCIKNNYTYTDICMGVFRIRRGILELLVCCLSQRLLVVSSMDASIKHHPSVFWLNFINIVSFLVRGPLSTQNLSLSSHAYFYSSHGLCWTHLFHLIIRVIYRPEINSVWDSYTFIRCDLPARSLSNSPCRPFHIDFDVATASTIRG